MYASIRKGNSLKSNEICTKSDEKKELKSELYYIPVYSET